MLADFFDPRTWVPDSHEHRIYLTDDLELYAIVDAVDYPACVHKLNRLVERQPAREKYIPVRWSSLGIKWKNAMVNPKHYARRSTYEKLGEDGSKYESRITGTMVRNQQRTVKSEFLHQFIADRMGLVVPPGFRLDHKNGRTLDCRRENIRVVSHAFNAANKGGKLAHVDPAEWDARMVTVKGDTHESGRHHQGDPDADSSGATADRGSRKRKPSNRRRAAKGRDRAQRDGGSAHLCADGDHG